MQWAGWPYGYSISQDIIHWGLPECVKKGVYLCVRIPPLSCIFLLFAALFWAGLNNCQEMICMSFLKILCLSNVCNDGAAKFTLFLFSQALWSSGLGIDCYIVLVKVLTSIEVVILFQYHILKTIRYLHFTVTKEPKLYIYIKKNRSTN